MFEDNFSEHEDSLIGWSPHYSNPEILTIVQKNKKSSLIFAGALTLLFPLGFFIAGIVLDDLPLNEAISIGIGLGLLMLLISLWRIKGMNKPIWEGVVIKKYEKRKHSSDDHGSDTSYTEFIVVAKSDQGKKRKIKDGEMYSYFSVGDRIRYHPNLETYEKYDKSKDNIIYCNVCRRKNPIVNERCEHCKSLLFK